MEPVVLVEDLSFAYQDFPVLKNVTFHVNSGEFIGVIGPNGGGKTTLLKLIMGFLQPTSGTIKVFGKPPSFVLGHMAYVPQTNRFDKQFPISVMEVVLMGRLSQLSWYGKYSKEDHRAAVEALKKVGLLEFKDRSFGTLSGGQAQRVLIARALASNPSLLILDEPTASVDVKVQGEIYALLKHLSKDMTIIMVTHDLGIAIELVQKVFCVQQHVITLKPEEVCEHFALGLYHSPLISTIGPHKK